MVVVNITGKVNKLLLIHSPKKFIIKFKSIESIVSFTLNVVPDVHVADQICVGEIFKFVYSSICSCVASTENNNTELGAQESPSAEPC